MQHRLIECDVAVNRRRVVFVQRQTQRDFPRIGQFHHGIPGPVRRIHARFEITLERAIQSPGVGIVQIARELDMFGPPHAARRPRLVQDAGENRRDFAFAVATLEGLHQPRAEQRRIDFCGMNHELLAEMIEERRRAAFIQPRCRAFSQRGCVGLRRKQTRGNAFDFRQRAARAQCRQIKITALPEIELGQVHRVARAVERDFEFQRSGQGILRVQNSHRLREHCGLRRNRSGDVQPRERVGPRFVRRRAQSRQGQ